LRIRQQNDVVIPDEPPPQGRRPGEKSDDHHHAGRERTTGLCGWIHRITKPSHEQKRLSQQAHGHIMLIQKTLNLSDAVRIEMENARRQRGIGVAGREHIQDVLR
jgi:hypothetical protein